MLMKEFERTENELENKVGEAQKRFDAEQTKVKNEEISLKFNEWFRMFRSANFKAKSMRRRKISTI